LVVSALGVMVTVERSTTDPGATVDITDPSSVEAIAVEHLFDLAIDFEPMKIYPSPFGTRIDAIVRQGKAEGPRLQGEVLAGGGDWIVVGDDNIGRLDVRATIRTHDGEMVYVTNAGRVAFDDEAQTRFLAGETVAFDDMHARAAPLFETGSDPYRWLNRTVAVGIVVELSLEHIRYQVYALS
jgi:hypothetical protein